MLFFKTGLNPGAAELGKFLGLSDVLETDDEDENHLGLAGPKKVLWFVCSGLHRLIVTLKVIFFNLPAKQRRKGWSFHVNILQ